MTDSVFDEIIEVLLRLSHIAYSADGKIIEIVVDKKLMSYISLHALEHCCNKGLDNPIGRFLEIQKIVGIKITTQSS